MVLGGAGGAAGPGPGVTPLPLSRGLCAGVWWRRVANVANVANSFGVALTGANMGHELATCAPSPRVVPVANVANYPPLPWQGRRAGGRGDRPGLFGVPSGAAEVLATARVLRRGYSPSRPRCSSRWPSCSSSAHARLCGLVGAECPRCARECGAGAVRGVERSRVLDGGPVLGRRAEVLDGGRAARGGRPQSQWRDEDGRAAQAVRNP